MAREHPESGPAVENRWWVDTGRAAEHGRSAPSGARPPVGSTFFDIGYAFEQEDAKRRLTDSNLRVLDEARPQVGEWKLVQTVPGESVPTAQLARMKRRLPLPPGARGVIVDSGRSARFIMTGEPAGERILEFTLGEESSFDCWIRGEWVHEERFRNLNDALRKASRHVRRYLESSGAP